MSLTTWTPELRQQVAQMIEAGKNSAEIAAVIQSTPKAVISASHRHKLGNCKSEPKRAPIPATFATDVPNMTQQQLSEKYGRSRSVIARWEERVGLKRDYRNRGSKKPEPKRTMRPGQGVFIANGAKPMALPASPHVGLLGDAVRLLQRDVPVYRCTEQGRADQSGRRWRVGRMILTDAEVMLRAEAKRARA